MFEGESVLFECYTRYDGGSWQPTLTFYNSLQDIEPGSVACPRIGDDSFDVRECLNITADRARDELSYWCEITFVDDDDFNANCSYQSLEVHCELRRCY